MLINNGETQTRPQFEDWETGLQEVKKSLGRETVFAVARAGMCGVAILAVIIGIVWIVDGVLDSTLDGPLKVVSIFALGGMLFLIAIIAFFAMHIKGYKDASDNQQGCRVGENQPRSQSNDEEPARCLTSENGCTLNGRGH